MDSMRHLSTSLPRGRNEPTTDLLSDFKAAALSVTNLYKTAAKSQDRARAAGYQDALDDLLGFLDKENLGLMDGEGWRVRQWATERLDGDGSAPRQGAGVGSTMAEDEDDGSTTKEDDKEDERSSSPEMQRRPQGLTTATSELTEEDSQQRRVSSEPPQAPAPLQSDFTFQSSHAYPSTNHDRDANNSMDLDNSTAPSMTTSSTPSSTDTVRIISRPQRGNKHNSRRNDNRIPTLNFNLGSGAGSKRKMPYQDFFDISNINNNNDNDRKDGGGGNGRGGKRGRHV